ncbi:MAG: FAD-dependent oxidoreductase [Lachnospiraceae bacterium]|nr:FAD-dependent oxidoreductase [Lachnospiraceae bacterium]MDD7664962.1 FAD-dependent oxidoreductase [Lachnospiraceae bacterium]MDY4164378.1 FAD-dependent oxidoreductase [Lachnospiraceae bacterium]
MSIRIDQIKIKPESDCRESLIREAAERLHISEKDITDLRILKKSIDARKKPDVFLLYQVAVEVSCNEQKLLNNRRIKNIFPFHKTEYHLKRVFSKECQLDKERELPTDADSLSSDTDAVSRDEVILKQSRKRPVIVGFGPAGLFAGLVLSEAGLCPIIIERGKPVTERRQDVEKFFETGILVPDSNVQFGEGGAGTFSDGKLNTGVHDKNGRNHFVLETFVKYGAPSEILYEAKPHIGTDRLIEVVSNIRKAIIEKGGEVRFNTKMTKLIIKNGGVTGIEVKESDSDQKTSSENSESKILCSDRSSEIDGKYVNTVSNSSLGESLYEIDTDTVILAIGHSARDTFQMLYDEKIPMSAKQFAMGFRIEHPQSFINESQYGREAAKYLPAAPYKLAYSKGARGVYSFCMCPGGYVVNASSEAGHLAVNGMSNYGRDSANANSAIVVAVGAGEYDLNDPLGAIEYQRSIEKKAYDLCQGKIPQQLYGDFKDNRESKSYGDFESLTKGAHAFANLRGIYSPEIERAFIDGMDYFDKRIHGFARYDAILSGVESRTSSPVRIPRDDTFQSSIHGLYPCGEGAGYAGGITSAAIDGIKVAEAVIGPDADEF